MICATKNKIDSYDTLCFKEFLKAYYDKTIPHICHFFTQAKFLENKIYTEKTRKLRQNTQKIAIFVLLRQNTQ